MCVLAPWKHATQHEASSMRSQNIIFSTFSIFMAKATRRWQMTLLRFGQLQQQGAWQSGRQPWKTRGKIDFFYFTVNAISFGFVSVFVCVCVFVLFVPHALSHFKTHFGHCFLLLPLPLPLPLPLLLPDLSLASLVRLLFLVAFPKGLGCRSGWCRRQITNFRVPRMQLHL